MRENGWSELSWYFRPNPCVPAPAPVGAVPAVPLLAPLWCDGCCFERYDEDFKGCWEGCLGSRKLSPELEMARRERRRMARMNATA